MYIGVLFVAGLKSVYGNIGFLLVFIVSGVFKIYFGTMLDLWRKY